jgi:hypothetical protein
MNLTGCEIRFVLFGPDGRVTRVEPYNSNLTSYVVLLAASSWWSCLRRGLVRRLDPVRGG